MKKPSLNEKKRLVEFGFVESSLYPLKVRSVLIMLQHTPILASATPAATHPVTAKYWTLTNTALMEKINSTSS